MAYEVSESVGAGTVITTDIDGNSGQGYQGGYFNLDGTKLFVPTWKMNRGNGGSVYGFDVWSSGSSGWTYASEYGSSKYSGSNYRIANMAVISDTQVIGLGYGTSKYQLFVWNKGESAQWTQSRIDEISHYQDEFALVMNPARTRGLMMELDGTDSHLIWYDGSDWNIEEDGVVVTGGTEKFQGATWINDTTFAVSNIAWSSNAGYVRVARLKSGTDGSATSHWVTDDSLVGNSSTHKYFGSGLHYHTGSNTMMVVAADGTTDTYPASGLSDPTAVDMYTFVSGTDSAGFLPAAASGMTTTKADIFSWNLRGYVPDPYNGDRFWTIADTDGGNTDSTSPKLICWEYGSSGGWKTTTVADSTFRHLFSNNSDWGHNSVSPVVDNRVALAVPAPTSVNSGNSVRIFSINDMASSGGGGGGGGGGVDVGLTKIGNKLLATGAVKAKQLTSGSVEIGHLNFVHHENPSDPDLGPGRYPIADGDILALHDASDNVVRAISMTDVKSYLSASVSTNITASGNTLLGDATGDTVAVAARFITGLVPKTDSVNALGASGLAWSNLYVDAIDLNGQGSISMGGTGRIDLDADDDTSIRASADDVITFEAGGTDVVAMKATGIHIIDDKKIYFGTGDDASFEYDEDGTDTLLYAGASMRISDDTKLEFGTGGDASFEYDEDGTDTLLYDGASLRINDDTKLEFGVGGDASFEYDEDGTDTLLYAGASLRISDDTKLEFGVGGDASFEYDEDGTDTLLYAGASMRISDDTKIEFGTGGDASIEYDEDGDDVLQIAGSNVRIGHGAATQLQFRDSTVHISSDADGYLSAQADTGVNLNIGGTDILEATSAGVNVVGTITGDTSLTLDAVTITTAEIGVLDSVTAGTAAGSKAVVLDASKNIATIGTVGCGAITSTGASSFGSISGVGNVTSTGTVSGSAGTFHTLSADHLNVQVINSTTRTDATLEVADKMIIAAVSASSAHAAGGGLQIGGSAGSDSVASIKYDHSNTALDFSIGGTVQYRLTDGAILPEANNDIDLGSDSLEFKDLWIDGTAYLDAVDIDGGAIDGTPIGANSAAAGTFTTLVAGGNVDLGDATGDTITATGRFDSDLVPSSDGARDLGTSALQWAEAHIDTGHIDTVTATNVDGILGANTAAAATVTSLSVSDGNITNVGDLNCDTISVDDASVGLDVQFGGATTLNKISMEDNLADALNINQGGTSYMKFVTTNSGERIVVGKELVVSGALRAPDLNLDASDAHGGIVNKGGKLSVGFKRRVYMRSAGGNAEAMSSDYLTASLGTATTPQSGTLCVYLNGILLNGMHLSKTGITGKPSGNHMQLDYRELKTVGSGGSPLSSSIFLHPDLAMDSDDVLQVTYLSGSELFKT